MASAEAHGDVACPDPSVHGRSQQLSEQASTAALYVTHPERAMDGRDSGSDMRENPLGPDGKLSSKSAAASLKYAKPTDLPSFPTHGASAGSAGKAAMMAKDYRMKELWQPEQSVTGSKAAVLAAGKGGKLDLWQASATADGHSAATMAMRNKGLGPIPYAGVDAENRNKALLAATMSHNKGRQRSGSMPAPADPAYPDSHNSTRNALNAATVSHSTTVKGMAPDGWSSEANQAARIKNVGTNMGSTEMFGDHPPVDVGNEEAKHQAALRASAISMAKSIYETQNRSVMTSDMAEVAGAQTAANRSSTSTQPDIKQEAVRYIHLQEAAHKLAAERLAKVDKNFEAARYREYYGYDDKPKRLSSRMSLRSAGGRQRKRASSEGTADQYDSDDEEQARRIRTQMSQLSTGLGQVDQKKQQDDRAKLLAAAEKKVTARMHDMDEKVYAETGRIPPALQEEWEAKARERAQKEREIQAQNPGKTHIGGGKFMDQSEIEAIAAARLKPTLDEINETAEGKRARDEELRLEREEQERVKQEERAQKKEEKDEQKKVKNEEKAGQKKQKEEEKARKAEEKRIAKEDKRKSREIKRGDAQEAAAATAGGAALGDVAEKVKEDQEATNAANADDAVQKHRSALSRLKDRFRKSYAADGKTSSTVEEKPSVSDSGKGASAGAVGGATAGAVTEADLGQEQSLQSARAEAELADDVHDADNRDSIVPTAQKVVLPAAEAEAVAPVIPVETAIESRGDTTEESAEPSSQPERPRFEQKPSMVGYGNDEAPESERAKAPNLERHISKIPDSDDDEDDDEDWNDERREKTAPAHALLGKDEAETVAERVDDAPVVASSSAPTAEMSVEPSMPLNVTDNETSVEAPGAANAASQPGHIETKLETEPDHKEHTILRQIINPSGKKFDHQAFGDNAVEVPADAAPLAITAEKESPSNVTKVATAAADTKPSTSSQPQEQDKERKGLRGLLSKLGGKKSKESKQQDSGAASKAASSAAPKEAINTSEKQAVSGPSGAAVVATSDVPTTHEATATSPTLPKVDAGPSLTDRTDAEGAAGDEARISNLNEPESPSSFRRGEVESHDLDDVSSGADEDDIARGREGRASKKMGFGNSRTTRDFEGKAPTTAAADSSGRQNSGGVSGTEDEQFEEARDHFDENLAPPPAFAGQAKSQSPVRGTKFQEQL